MEYLIQIIIGIICVFFGILIERYYFNKKEKLDKSTIMHNTTEKNLRGIDLEKLLPNTTVGNMKAMLGEPLKYENQDWSLMKKDPYDTVQTNVYLYKLSNCNLKITSKNNISIDTVTVLALYPNEIDIKEVLLGGELILGKSKLYKEQIENASNISEARTIKDVVGIVETYIPSPLYKTFTYFTDDVEKVFKFIESGDKMSLCDAIINGVCISKYMDESDSFYIFMYEWS